MASRNKRPNNQFRVHYYPDGKPNGLVCGEAMTIEKAREIAERRKPATIWNIWNRETDDRGSRYYHPILVEVVR